MVVRPGGPIALVGLPVLAFSALTAVFATVESALWWLTGGLCLVGLSTFVPLARLSTEGVAVRNYVRRRHFRWSEITCVARDVTTLPTTRAMGHSRLVLTTGRGTFPMAATTAMSSRRAGALIDALREHGVPLDPKVSSERFPRNSKLDMQESAAAAAEEWEREQDVGRRLRELRDRRP